MARLVFVSGTLPDVRAGSGTFVGISVLAATLRAGGHSISVLAPDPGPPSISLARRFAFNVRARGRVRRLAGSPGAGSYDLADADVDAVIGFDWDGIFVGRNGARRIVSIKGELAEEARFERGLARIRLTAESFLERANARTADGVVATSEHSRSRIRDDYGVPIERIAVVPEPIDLARWDRALADADAPARGAGSSPSRPSILCVAHLYPRKDVATLLEAFARMPPGAALRIVGTGPERERLDDRVRALGLSGRVELLGHVSFARLAEEYRRADIFCLPSRQEGFGIVFLEAMAAGLPIVAARGTAVPELVVDGVCGDLVAPGDPDALAAALGRLVSDEARRRALGEAGRRRVAAYDAPAVAGRFLRAIGLDSEAPAAGPAKA